MARDGPSLKTLWYPHSSNAKCARAPPRFLLRLIAPILGPYLAPPTPSLVVVGEKKTQPIGQGEPAPIKDPTIGQEGVNYRRASPPTLSM